MKEVLVMMLALSAPDPATIDFNDLLTRGAGQTGSDLIQVASDTAPTKETDVRSYIFSNSLVNHGTSTPETTVPHWMGELAAEAGNTYAVGGQFGFLHSVLPARPSWTFNRRITLWHPDSRKSFEEVDFTSVMLNPANYLQWRKPDEPYYDNPKTPVEATLEVIDWTTAREPGLRFLIYEGWSDMGGFISGSFPPSARELATYHDFNLGEYHDWYKDYVAQVKAARPNIDIRMIPVSSVLSKLLTQAPLNEIPVTEIYEDDAPHGTPTLYFLASLVTYAGTYGVAPPTSFPVPTSVHPVVRENYAAIVAAIAKQIGVD